MLIFILYNFFDNLPGENPEIFRGGVEFFLYGLESLVGGGSCFFSQKTLANWKKISQKGGTPLSP